MYYKLKKKVSKLYKSQSSLIKGKKLESKKIDLIKIVSLL